MTTDEIIENVIERETGGRADGGYTNDPSDPGGETKWGIAKRSHPELDIKNLTREMAKAIYVREYVEAPGFLHISDDALRAQLVDFGVNSGPARAIRFLQRLLRVEPTGILDGVTISTLWKHDPLLLNDALAGARAKFIDELTDARPEMKKFEEGLESRALDFVESVPPLKNA
jgi:lysozyme family protein